MTQKELHDVVSIAMEYAATKSAIDNAIRVLNDIKHISYYGYDSSRIEDLSYELRKELKNASDKFTQDEVMQSFKEEKC